jgi:hypothetical protein
MPECYQCGDEWPRDKMLTLDGWIDPPDDPDVVCLRCASVAMKGGPENMTEQELADHNIQTDA